jgi:hypothetical protein
MNILTKKVQDAALALRTKREDLTIYAMNSRPAPQVEPHISISNAEISDIYTTKVNLKFYQPTPRPNLFQSVRILLGELPWHVKYLMGKQKFILKPMLENMKRSDSIEPLTPTELNAKYKKPIYTLSTPEGATVEDTIAVDIINKTINTVPEEADSIISANKETIIANFNMTIEERLAKQEKIVEDAKHFMTTPAFTTAK